METFKKKESILRNDQDNHQRANDIIQIYIMNTLQFTRFQHSGHSCVFNL